MGMMERIDNTKAVKVNEFLTFKLGGQEYGIDILKVQEIRGYDAVTRIANAPAFIKGVVNLRGVIVPIVDLRVKFAVGEVVDSVSDVLELDEKQIKPAPEFNSLLDTGYITGLGTVESAEGERLLILVDIERLMSSPDMGLLERAAA